MVDSSTPSETPITSPTTPLNPIPAWLPLALLAATLAILFYRLLLGDVLFWGLPSLQFYPWREFAISELRAGRLPLWNPYNGAGAPLLANYQSALLYPPNLLSFLIVPGPQAMGWLALTHLFWAGLGAYLYGRALGLTPFACAVGMLAYALNGAVVARLGTQPMVDVASWLPWLLLTAERILRRPALPNAALLTLCAALQLLAGHAQWTFYSLLLVALYILYRVFVTPVGIVRFRTLALIGGSIALAFGLAAIQLLPTAELQRQSQRAGGMDEKLGFNFSYDWPALIMQANPLFYGNPGDGSYAINGAQFEINSYVGILPLVLALLAVGHGIRRWRRLRPVQSGNLPVSLIPFFAGLMLIAFIFAFGRNSPLYVFLYRHIPTFNQFQAPSRWLLWAVCGLSVLAAIGASVWQPSRLMRPRARLGLAGAIGCTAVGALLTIVSPGVAARGIFVLGVQLSGVALAFVLQPVIVQAPQFAAAYRRWAIGVLIFVAADLIWANALLNPTVSADFYNSHSVVSNAVTGRTFGPDDQINSAEFDHFLLFNDYRAAVQHQDAYRAADFPNMNLLDRQPSFNTFEPLRPSVTDRFTQLLEANTPSPPNLAEAAAIATITAPNPPRAWLVAQTTPTADPFGAMANPNWQPYRMAFVETDAPALSGASGSADSVKITHGTPLELDFSVQTTIPSALIVADTWYPGWIATVDGQPTPIYQANGAFRAVYVEAGAHTVTMRYMPSSLATGAAISAVSGIILVAALLFHRMRQDRSGVRRKFNH
ncbi:MAG: YfhO family protein [Aggregatilineales bacterium]